MLEQLQVADWTISWLRGGVTYLDGGAMFGVVPRPLWSKKYEVNDKNQIELRTDPILIQTGEKNILIESGIGNNRFNEKQLRNYGITEESFLEEDLRKLGLTVDDIDVLLMTHLHFDHVSGLAKEVDGILEPVFKNAIIYTTDIEWHEMRNPNIRSKNTYWENNWKPIYDQVKTFTGQMEIVKGITMHHTGGHSDGHAIIKIEHGGQTLLHLADLMPTHAHNHVLWVLAYDDYPMTSIAQKEKWLVSGIENENWFLFYHDAKYRALKWSQTGEVKDCVERVR